MSRHLPALIWRTTLLSLTAAALLSACSPDETAKPDLILVSLDTVRADVFADVAATNPVLARVLAASVRFKAAATSAPLTLPAHTSLLTGLDPNRHGVRNNGDRVATTVPLLAERLRAQGYRTTAVVSAFPLDRQFGLARGFDRYDQPASAGGPESSLAILERRGDASVDRALAELTPAAAPQFLWLHLFDAHAPYVAPGTPAGAGLREAYRAEVAYVAHQLGRLVVALEQRQRPFVLVVVGDHGEGLGDHDELDHGLLLYDSTVLVPMFWYAPDRFRPAMPKQTPRLIDVAPTLAAIAGIEDGVPTDGIDLQPLLLAAGDLQIPPAYAETRYPELAYRTLPLRSLRDGRWKLIATRDETELYDLAEDAAETRDRSDEERARADAMQLDLWQRPETAPQEAVMTPEVARQLQGLGYVNTSRGDAIVAGHPRSIVASHRRLVELQSMLGSAAPAQVLAQARQLATDEPGNAFAHELLGSLLLEQGDLAGAIAALDAAARLNPDNSETRYKLAEALMHAGRHVDALGHWQMLELLEPQRAGVWTNEAAALASLGNWAEAWAAIQQGLTLGANDANTLDNAALIAERLRRWGDAARLQQQRAGLAEPPFRDFGRLALNQLRSTDTEGARHSLSEARARGINDPLLALANVLLAIRDGDGVAAKANADELQRAQPRLWQAAQREFPELASLTH
ncbi:MAG: sulfatase-like hydrolase/transferase [Xanthomonadales bacterium]|nr:sulfatase-like hydrolase/transferase [Xanthomonadales bacterium]